MNDALPGPRAPDWEVLFAHHLPARYDRTLAARWGSRTIHLCARCTGQVAGLVVFLGLYLASSNLPFGLFAPATQLAFAAAPLPAAIDWISQSLGRRESTNRLRLVSGLLLGVAWADALALLLTTRWFFFLGAIVVAAVYTGAIFGILRITGAWRRVLDEHFPGLAESA